VFESVERGGVTSAVIRPPAVLFKKTAPEPLRFVLDTWDRKDLEYTYRVTGPGGAIAAEGAWPTKAAQVAVLEGAPGLYRLSVEGLHPNRTHTGAGTLMIPLTPPDVPEVMAFERDEQGTHVGMGIFESQYWFQPPSGLTNFWVEFHHPAPMDSIWDPTGQRVWVEHAAGEEGNRKVHGIPIRRVTLRIPADQAGRPWRITRPGWNFGFVMDPAIPPYFSVSRKKWFHPEK
jgi:hypothetical protein